MKGVKGEDPRGHWRPFVDVNIIFTGDFGQLPPVWGQTLYSYSLTEAPSFRESKNPTGINAMNRVFLWRQVDTVVKLRRKHCQKDDTVYSELLDRIQTGDARRKSTSSPF